MNVKGPMSLAIDLFCGLGGWTEGLLAEGYTVVGFDIERRPYPAQLVLQDALTVHGSQFRDAALIVASPPCQFFSYIAMPWTRAKLLGAVTHLCPLRLEKELALFKSCFRIQREASEAAGRHIPLVVENVRGAQPWVGPAKWNYGSFYLWGDVPAIMPFTFKGRKLPGNNGPRMWSDREIQRLCDATKNSGGSFNVVHNTTSGKGRNPDGRLVRQISPARRAKHYDETDKMQLAGVKHKDADGYERDHPQAFGWKSPRTSSSAKNSRKQASAEIAKIPFPLARHIARVYKPVEVCV